MAVKLSKLQLDAALDVLARAGVDLPEPKADETAYMQAVVDGLCGLIAADSGVGAAELCDPHGFEDRLAKEIDRIARTGAISLLLVMEVSVPEGGAKLKKTERGALAQGFATVLSGGMQTGDAIGVRDDGRLTLLLTNCAPEEAESAAQGLCKLVEHNATSVFADAGMPVPAYSVACGGAYLSQWSELSDVGLTERALDQLAQAGNKSEKGAICIETPPVCEVSAEEKALLFSLSVDDDINMGDSLDSSGQ